MGLGDLFRPKWKHSNAEVRLQAVKQLDEADPLAWVARQDSDPSVRKVAIKKVDALDVLEEVAAADEDRALRKLAQERVNTMLVQDAVSDDETLIRRALSKLGDERRLADVVKQASQEWVWQEALAKLNDPKALADVARTASNAAIRLAALERVDDSSVLRGIAVDDDRKEMGIAALERIENVEWLKEIAKKGKNKAVRARAKRRVATLSEPSDAEKDQQLQAKKHRAQQTQLCHMVEAAAKSKNLEKAADKISEAQEAWEALEVEIDPALQERFTKACERFFERQQARADKDRHDKEAAEQRAKERAEQQLATDERDAEAAAADVAQQQVIEAERQERREKELAQLQALVEEAEGLAEQPLKEARFRWNTLLRSARRLRRTMESAPELAERLNAAEAALEERQAAAERKRAEDAEHNLQRLEALLVQLEELKKNDIRRDVERGLTDAQKAFRKMGPLPERNQREELRSRYETLRKELFIHLQELREADEWKRWSNVGQKEELCRRVEALKKEEDLKKAAQELRSLQAQWKKAGPVSRERADALWERFKGACDEVYKRCEGYFEQLEQEREENLQKKEELCNRVEALSDSEDWEKTANEIKGLQAEWKDIGPAPREKSDEIWKRFRGACDVFFDRRKEHYDELNQERKENLKQKEELCEEVEALVDSTDWQVTTEKIKGLQAMWKKIGPVPRKRSDGIWKRFRGACDKFFENREDAREEERHGALKDRQKLCAEIESLVATDVVSGEFGATPEADVSPEVVEVDDQGNEVSSSSKHAEDQAVKKVLAARDRWKRMGRVPRSKEEVVNHRFNQACAKVVLAFPAAFAGTELDIDLSRRRRERICQRMEKLLEQCPDGAPTVQVDGPPIDGSLDPERAAEQLREALAQNALGTSDESGWSWNEAQSEMEELERGWTRVGPVGGEAGMMLNRRFEAARDGLQARLPSQGSASQGQMRGEREERKGRGRGRRPKENLAKREPDQDEDDSLLGDSTDETPTQVERPIPKLRPRVETGESLLSSHDSDETPTQVERPVDQPISLLGTGASLVIETQEFDERSPTQVGEEESLSGAESVDETPTKIEEAARPASRGNSAAAEEAPEDEVVERTPTQIEEPARIEAATEIDEPTQVEEPTPDEPTQVEEPAPNGPEQVRQAESKQPTGEQEGVVAKIPTFLDESKAPGQADADDADVPTLVGEPDEENRVS